MASPQDELLARYREIDDLIGGVRQSPEFRRWQARTAELLRKALGFHPAVVEFQGLRFRAGPVHAATEDEFAAIPAAEHDARMRQDLSEAKRLLRRALAHFHVDADAAVGPGPVDALDAAAEAVPDPERAAVREAAARLKVALRATVPTWREVGPELRLLLGAGLPVARAALAAVAARLDHLR